MNGSRKYSVCSVNIIQLWERRKSCHYNHIGGPGGLYAKWNKPDSKANTVWHHLDMESKK